MKIARREYFSLYLLFASTYLFVRIFFLDPMLVSSAWITVGCAFIAALPVLFSAWMLIGIPDPMYKAFDFALGKVGARIWYVLVLLLALIILKNSMETFTASVLTYTADLVIDRSVLISTLLVAGLGAYIGHMAIANCARIALRLGLITLGALALVALSWAKYEYFFPLLGPGIGKLSQAILPNAGALLLPMLFLFNADTCEKKLRGSLIGAAGFSALCVIIIMAIYTVSMPTLPVMPLSLSFRTDMMVFNGNSGIQQQLPLITLWNACQLLMISAMISLCSEILRLIIPRIGRLCAPIITLVAIAISLFVKSDDIYRQIVDICAYPLIILGFGLAGIIYSARKKHARTRDNAG